jgi:ERCC4-type nuclease
MWSPVFGTVGVQRKTVTDLVASLGDGRLQREITDMKGLDVGIWMIEGNPEWTSDGQLLGSRTSYQKDQHMGLLFSLQSRSFWLATPTNQNESIGLLLTLQKWLRKKAHKSLLTRPGPEGSFGVVDRMDWQIHFLQGLPGVGYERARAIIDHYSGLPFRLDGGLRDVAGLGPKTARRIEEMFGKDGKGEKGDEDGKRKQEQRKAS